MVNLERSWLSSIAQIPNLARVGIIVFLAVFFATIGPFGEYQSEPFLRRLGNWSLDMVVGTAIFVACHAIIKTTFRHTSVSSIP